VYDPLSLRPPPHASPRRRRTYEVIFEHDTRAGRTFDVVLILAILASVVAIMLESVASIRATQGHLLRVLEWLFTVSFTVEYALRLWCVSRPLRYARSFLGVIDLLAFLPTYVSLVVPGGQVLTVVRILRVLRVFRILKLAQYVGEARVLAMALRASRFKITVFVFAVLTIVVIVGALMYLIEGPSSGFTSIPAGVYWAVVTLTTVGFGDITPHTPLGQTLATAVMIMGYGIIAVPTGIVTAEIAYAARAGHGPPRRCAGCGREGHDGDARHCKWCGGMLPV
jgi:voltage-gated potassium channel